MSVAQDTVWQGGRWSRYSCWNCQLSIMLCTTDLWGITQVRAPDSDSFFFSVFLCVCVVLFCLHCVVHMCVYVYVCDCVSEGERWCQDKFFSTFQLVLWDRVFQWNLPLSSLANVTSHLLGNPLSSVSWGKNYGQAFTCIYVASGQCFSPLVWTTITLTLQASLQLARQSILNIEMIIDKQVLAGTVVLLNLC